MKCKAHVQVTVQVELNVYDVDRTLSTIQEAAAREACRLVRCALHDTDASTIIDEPVVVLIMTSGVAVALPPEAP